MNFVLREQPLGLLALNTCVHDNIIAGLPIDRGGNSVFITQLDRINHSYNLIEISACDGGVVQFEPDLLGRVDDEDCTDSEWETRRGFDVGSILVVEHVVQIGDTAVTVSNDGIIDFGFTVFVDILDPFVVVVQFVRADTDDLYVPLFPVTSFGASGDFTELGSAYGSEVSRVRKKHTP